MWLVSIRFVLVIKVYSMMYFSLGGGGGRGVKGQQKFRDKTYV